MKTHIFFKHIISLTIILIFSFSLYSQEICNNGIDDDGDGLIDMNDVVDCNCAPIPIPSMIPNPSFEQTNCCPTTYSQVSCATGWSQATNATSDYFNCGYNFGAATNAGLVPPPDGTGYLGTIFSSGWQEYIGSCLPTSLLVGETYTLTLNIASIPIDGFGEVCNGGIINYGAIDLTVFGNSSCVPFPISTTNCPSGWDIISSVAYTPVSSWNTITFTFTPTSNFNSIIIGSPCSLPVDYNNSGGCYPYFLFDNLVLVTPNTTNITQTGNFCTNDLVLSSTNNPTSTYQWYYGGVALLGETLVTLQISANNYPSGDYTLVENFSDSTCGSMDINLPPPPIINANFSVTSQCDGTPVNFNDVSTISSGTITNWSWDFGDNNISASQNPSHTYSADSTYSVQLIVADNNQCSDTVSINVIVYPNPIPTITQNDTVLTSSFATTYQWYLDGSLILDATEQDITLFSNGTYIVGVTDTNGCYAESEPYIVTGINTFVHDQKVKLYPNPANKQLHIILDNEFKDKNILFTIFNSIGQSLYTTKVVTNNSQHIIPVDYLPSGMFYLNVFEDGISFNIKFVVQH